MMIRAIQFIFILFTLINLNSCDELEYSASDDPTCTTDCATSADSVDCYEKQINYLNYRLVKSVFNYGKLAIYAGLWTNRYSKADKNLFENTYYSVLEDYSNYTILSGNINADQLKTVADNIFDKIRGYINSTVEYSMYPNLQCPIECTYDLVTWQTLLGLSIAIFVLAAITTGIYSVYLHKQYKILRNRLRNIKYTKIPTTATTTPIS